MTEPTILIVEDGNEYLENLSRFVPGPRYVQAKSGAEAVAILRGTAIDLIYLDMRFDRISRADLLGDHAAATREHNGDPARAWRYLETNQGLFILNAVRQAGLGGVPVILAYDFSRERPRFAHLSRMHPTLHWVPDAITPDEIRSLIVRLIDKIF